MRKETAMLLSQTWNAGDARLVCLGAVLFKSACMQCHAPSTAASLALVFVPFLLTKNKASTAGYLRFHPIVSLQFSCCDLSVREKDWRGKPGL